MTRVSVIIPAYNGDRFIAEAIQSVLMQTYSDWELIIVDDGSTDKTGEIVESYLTQRPDQIRYVVQKNQGVAAARNKGFSLSKGAYVAFLDQDDVWLPQKLELQVSCFDKNADLGIVHSGWQRINARREKISNIEPWKNAPKLDLNEWLQWMPILLSAMLFRREWIEKKGGFDTNFKQACDVELVQQLALMGCRTAWVKKITTGYRQHDSNDSLNTLLQAKESWEVRNKFFAQPNLPEAVKKLENQYRYHTLVWIAWRLCITNQFESMMYYLMISLNYSSLPPVATMLDWVRSYSSLSVENGYNLSLYPLLTSKEWNVLTGIIAMQMKQTSCKKKSQRFQP